MAIIDVPLLSASQLATADGKFHFRGQQRVWVVVATMKQRFSYLDLRIITNEVSKELENCYLQNIYSLESSSRHFMLKFDAGVGKTGKTFLLVDPGMRYHLTKFQHEPTNMPSFFVQKLRKYLKNRRATNFWTAPGSRLMVITFTEGQYYLVFEFFAGGNLILLDQNHKILTLFRTVRGVGPNHQDHQLGETYPLDMTTESSENKFTEGNLQPIPSRDDVRQWVLADKLGKALYSKVSDPSSSLLEYFLRLNGLDPKVKLKEDEVDTKLDAIYTAIEQSLAMVKRLVLSENPVPGYIVFNDKDQSTEFEPFREYFDLVHPEAKVETFPSYNATVDSYFGAILSDKAVNKVDQLLALAESRLTAARNEKENRIRGLESTQQKNQEIGDALQENADVVDSAIMAVQALVDQGVDWGDAEQLLKLEKDKGNQVAEIIKKLELEKHQFVVHLNGIDITVQLGMSAFANAREYFELKRIAGAKIEKTAQHATRALKSAEVKIRRDLEVNLEKHKQQGNASKLHAIRQPHWFEKFWWFITSNQFLVVAARDESQKNMLLRRYFSDNDLVLGSDAPEASLLIIKNPKGEEVPPQTLLQACAFCAASSTKTWEAKSKAPAWYLTRKQVPRINDLGDPVSANDLNFIKNKMVVPPTQTDMGVAILWQCEFPDQDDDEGVTPKLGAPASANGDSDEEDFPDTNFDSDDDFPDTQLDSDFGSDDDNDDNDGGLSDSSVPPAPQVDSEPEQNVEQDDDKEDTNSQEEPNQEPSQEPESVSEDEAEEEAEEATEEQNSEEKSPTPTATNVKKARGSKKKLRKYQNQDEDDRRAAMERLGTLKGLQRKAAEQEEKENARKQEQQARQFRKERARKADLEHATDSPPESTPFPDDLLFSYKTEEPIIAAVVMFAPWTALQKAQYKAKLVFGPMKKGKASSEVLRVLLNTGIAPASEREKQLVAGIRPIDVQQSIAVSKVQISTGTAAKGASSKGSNAKGGKANQSSKSSKGGKGGKGKKK